MQHTPQPKTMFYCVSTHWDREWYESFQEFRMWLVETIDGLVHIMESNPEFKHAHLDGQTVVVEDYLMIRPEMKDRLVKLIREGRISIGPWYVLPDEWLISGESYVRNFALGKRVCDSLGVEPLDFCYTPDQFGHIAALPMIARGVGLHSGVVWRGTYDEGFAPQFAWEGPDGSVMPTHKLFDEAAYGWLFYKIRHIGGCVEYDEAPMHDMIAGMVAHEEPRLRTPFGLILDGNDHQLFGEHMVRLFEGMKRDFPYHEWRWASLEEYGKAVGGELDTLPRFKGELRETTRDHTRACQALIAHVISSRYPVKQANDRCQALLEKWAEPTALFSMIDGAEPILSYLDTAWRYLLKNHPHDSICGCSIDQVHRDMMYRFDQSRLIADGFTRRLLAGLSKADASDRIPLPCAVWNPLPWKRSGVIEAEVSFPAQWPNTHIENLSGNGAEPVNKFTLVGSDGTELPFQLRAIDRRRVHNRIGSNGRNLAGQQDVYHLAVEMDLPPAGVTGFTVQPSDLPIRPASLQRTGPLSASNGLLSLAVASDGTVTLTRLDSGKSYPGLFQYEDRADNGDGWTWGPIVADQIVVSPGARVTASVTEDGPLRTVFRIERELDLPARVAFGTPGHFNTSVRRSPERVQVPVVDELILDKGCPYVRVRTTVNNTAWDHRLRVILPTGLAGATSFAETPFAMVERPVSNPPEGVHYQERVPRELPYATFFGVTHEGEGMAVVSPSGTHEYELTETDDRSLVLTLFRSTHITVQTDGEPDGLLLQPMDFEYLLVPFGGAPDAAALARLAAETQTGVRVLNTAEPTATRSWVEVQGDGVVPTALKPSDDGQGGLVRLWNPGTTPAPATVKVTKPLSGACLCDLLERPGDPLSVEGKTTVNVVVPAGGLVSILLNWQDMKQ